MNNDKYKPTNDVFDKMLHTFLNDPVISSLFGGTEENKKKEFYKNIEDLKKQKVVNLDEYRMLKVCE